MSNRYKRKYLTFSFRVISTFWSSYSPANLASNSSTSSSQSGHGSFVYKVNTGFRPPVLAFDLEEAEKENKNFLTQRTSWMLTLFQIKQLRLQNDINANLVSKIRSYKIDQGRLSKALRAMSKVRAYNFWTRMEEAPPPPLQIEAHPYWPGFRACERWVTRRAPDIPIG